ncbi:MAG: ABC transporter permease subunit [Rhodobacteraceae bacterium]|nr:ABC transporter permease subunit [Paracoccaceae bacterium]
MTMINAAPRDDFRLSMLIYDTRYRAITIQLFVLALVLAAIWWLGSNLQANLEAKGRPLSFEFLWSRAGYDIGQTFIPYTSDSTHFRAMLVGLLNTLVLALFGCLFATIIGVIVGVLRLSKNWLVALLTSIYVEIFRNIPLLLWILVIFVPLYEMTPAPNAFKVTDEMIASGTEPAASMILGGTVAVTNRGTYIPGFLFDRGFEAGWMTTLAIFLVIAGSLAVHLTLNARARRVQEATGVRPTTWWKSLIVLFAPLVLVLWALGFHLDIPQPPTRFNFEGGVVVQNPFVAMLIALSLYTGAFIAEIVRAGIQSVSRGQTEAAFALGLRPNRTMNLVILPQALRVIIPPLISQFLNLTKNTSLGIAASYADLRGTLGGVTLNQTGREVEAMLLMMLIYLSISLIISSLMNVYNRSVQLKER